MKIVILFGGSGYIGSTVSKILIDKGYKVINMDFNKPNSYFLDPLYELRYEWANLDLSKDYTVDMNLGEGNELIGAIHFAAYKDLEESCLNPYKYYDNNLKSLLNALSICNKLKVPKFIFSSSAATYSDELIGEVNESDCTGNSNNPYGYTKIVGERLVKDICKQYEIKGTSLRYFNPIGNTDVSTDETESLFGNIKKCLKNRTPLTIFGSDYDTRDGTCMRDFIDLRDLAIAHIYVLESNELFPSDYRVFNVGTGNGTTVKEICDTVKNLNPDFNYIIGERRLGDGAGGYANTDKIKELGFSCRYSLEDSIKTII